MTEPPGFSPTPGEWNRPPSPPTVHKPWPRTRDEYQLALDWQEAAADPNVVHVNLNEGQLQVVRREPDIPGTLEKVIRNDAS